MRWWQLIKRLDWWLLGAVVILQTVSVLMMYGISQDRFQKQLLFVGFGIVLMLVMAGMNYRYVQNYAYVFYIAGALLLVGVLLFGTEVRGTTGWFFIFGVSLQPVELVKIILIVTLARFFSDHSFQFNNWRYIGVAFLITLTYSALVLQQPDLGSMMVFTLAFLGLLLLTNIKWKQVLVIGLFGCLTIVVAWFFVLRPYQQERILTFLNPAEDQLGAGYNVTQSIISVGSGQILGRGLGLGTQSQLQFLPERDTDFIFAVIAEELGLIGASGVILALMIVLWRLWYAMRTSRDAFTSYYMAGLALVIFVQSVINVGMNIGVMPVTGIPLPFVSAGGSSLIALMLGVGIAQNCYSQRGLSHIDT